MNKYRRSSGSSKIIILERHLATGNTGVRRCWMTSSNIGKDKSFVDDLNKERGIVSLRVALVPRSTEIQPSFCRFVPNHPFELSTTRGSMTWVFHDPSQAVMTESDNQMNFSTTFQGNQCNEKVAVGTLLSDAYRKHAAEMNMSSKEAFVLPAQRILLQILNWLCSLLIWS